VDFITDNENIQEEDFGYWMKKSREYIRDNPEMFTCPETELDDLNLDSEPESESNSSSDQNESTVTEDQSNASSNEISESVSKIVNKIENKSKQKSPKKNSVEKTQPTGDTKKRGRGRPPKE